MKLHLGCGPVYLEEYINIDMDLPTHSLSKDRPDLVDLNKTTIENYYKYNVTREDILEGKLHKQDVVVDAFAEISDLGFAENSIEEIRLVQVFEHFTFKHGEEVLNYWYSLLQAGGKIHLDIPDLYKTTENLSYYYSIGNLDETAWYTRLLFGSQKNDYGLHRAMYTEDSIVKLLQRVGFVDVKILPNIHFYPAFAVEGTKPNDA